MDTDKEDRTETLSQPEQLDVELNPELDKLVQVRKQRGHLKAAITRKRNEIKELINHDRDTTVINGKCDELREAFTKFQAKHLEYRSMIQKDQEDAESVDEYFEVVEQSVTNIEMEVQNKIFLPTQINTRSNVEDTVHPDDSVSNQGSRTSSVDSLKVKAKAKKAVLLAKADSLKKMQEVRRQKMELQLFEENLQLECDLAAVEAQEAIYSKYGSSSGHSGHSKHTCATRQDRQAESNLEKGSVGKTMLNPNAVEWKDTIKPDIDNACEQNSSTEGTFLPSDTKFLLRSIQQQQETINNLQSKIDKICQPETIYQAQDEKCYQDSQRFTSADPQGNPGACGVNKGYRPPEQYPSHTGSYMYVPTADERLLLLQQKMIDVVQLPKADLVTYSGDPLNYWTFVRTFDNTVGMTAVNDSIKLDRLLQYCRGKAYDVIQCCALMAPDEGYRQARKLLKERFGNEYAISKAWIDKVTGGPPIKPYDTDSLRSYADDVKGCMLTLKSMGKLNEVDNQAKMVKLVEKLPMYLQGRWRKRAVGMLEVQGVYPDIVVLTNFIETAAKEMSDPVFGCSPTHRQKETVRPVVSRTPFSKGASTNFNIQANMTESNKATGKQDFGKLVCHFCQQNHPLSRCEKFKAMSPEKRLEFAREKSMCYNCFSTQHRSNTCQKSSRCSIQGCLGMHSRLLHVANYKTSRPTVIKENSAGNVAEEQKRDLRCEPAAKVHSSTCSSSAVSCTKVALPVVPIKVRASGSTKFVTTFALLDTGSTNTFCSQALIDQLGLKGTDTPLSLTTLGKENVKARASVVSLEVTDVDERNFVKLPQVFSTPKLPLLTDNVTNVVDTDKWQHLCGIDFPQLNGENVLLLIGQDSPSLLAPIEVRSGSQNDPYASRTMLGWTLNGPLHVHTEPKVVSHFVKANDELQAQIECFWKLETSESTYDCTPQLSLNDKKAIQIWENSIEKVEGHYQVDIPFKAEPPKLPNNFTVAKVRLESLKKKLTKQPELHQKYKAEMDTLLAKGYAERVGDEEVLTAVDRTWYLPHHGVTSERKPEKLRIVFDCAAKYNGTSLNDFVLQGPDLNNTLMGVLLRFRQKEIGIMGDVEAMFHQVKVTPKDRDVLRFLWWEDGNMCTEPQVFRMTVHPFGGVWSPSCATYVLKRIAENNVEDCANVAANTVKNNFYVDDCLKSVDTSEEAIEIVKHTTALLEGGGFKITKWVSNSCDVINSIPIERRAKGIQDLGTNPLPTETALGVTWKTGSDRMGFNITPKTRPETRRGLVSLVSSLYDPFGLACPVILQAKKLFQDECKMGKDWDDPLNRNNLQKWRQWTTELPELEGLEIDRCFVPAEFGTIQYSELHHFSDASMDGYGSVSYIRMVNTEGQIHVAFLIGKARLAPIKQLTIPRLELSAAVLSVKIDRLLKKELQMDFADSTFWTDSMVVLHYIRSKTKRFHVFVANRVACIHEGSSPEHWRHVESCNNPADDASRGLSARELVSNRRWIQGPEFLSKPEDEWPDQPHLTSSFLNGDTEVKQELTVCLLAHSQEPLHDFICRFSCWDRLRKCVAWLMRFKRLLLEKCKTRDGAAFLWNRGFLKVEEVKTAEAEILKVAQRKDFSEELKALSKTAPLKTSSNIINLDPLINDKGLLCVGGRLRRALIEEDARHPVIIPKNHHVGVLLIRHYHHQLAHSGKEHVLSELRQHYWLIKARPAVKKELRDCIVCRRQHGKFMNQRMADLPQDRVTAGKPPFSNVGVDCFGFFLIKRGRSLVKRYGCLFTCMATRAIHLEKLDTMETDSFVNALTRFQCRRGRPEKIRSDNGTNFKGAFSEIQQAIRLWNQEVISTHLLQQNIQWEFNPPTASHMGGVWERQIRTVRQTLKVLLKDQRLDDESLSTMFCEVESIVNSRPLTAVSDNAQDLDPITPNHLLLLRSGSNLPYGQFTGADGYRKRWKHVQFLADQFWRRWLREYLPTLQVRQKWFQSAKNLRVGDVVLVLNENVPRRDWPLGRVVATFAGDDGLVRSVDVKTRSNVLRRPVNKLCFLESVDD